MRPNKLVINVAIAVSVGIAPIAGDIATAIGVVAERFILFTSDFALHNRIIANCQAAGFDPKIVYESSQWDFIGEMAGADLGISMLPGTICRLLDPLKVTAVPLVEPVIPWQLVMAWKREGYLSLAAREWIAFTRESLSSIT